jgi:hypothetical protein
MTARKSLTWAAVGIALANEVRGLIVVAGLIASGAAGEAISAAFRMFR